VSDAAGGHGYYEGTVAGAVAKRRQRMFYASAAALRRVAAHAATTRAEAVRRARRRRYEQVPGKLIVTRIGHGTRPRLAWRDEHGRAADAPLAAISPDERMRLFTVGEDGLEPLWLWLGESGMPMAYESWGHCCVVPSLHMPERDRDASLAQMVLARSSNAMRRR